MPIADVIKKGDTYFSRCPYCSSEKRLSPRVAAHQHIEIVFTCPTCEKQSLHAKHCMDMAKEED